jgi:hypothetical protein
MRQILIDFCDFWPGFPKAKNFFTEALRLRYDVQLSERPDILIYSGYGFQHRLHTCPRVFYTGEPGMPDWRECDYALTFHYLDDPRHLRLPLYALYASPVSFHVTIAQPGPMPEPPEPAEQALARKTKFCAFVVGNVGRKSTQKRVEFFQRLNRHRRVDSGGRALNNIGGPIPNGMSAKQAFLRPYKFNLCFENRSLPGYTTEKIYEALLARCIPIYWGNPRIHEEFNPRCFLNYFDFPNEEALIERILEIDGNPELHLDYLRQPIFPDGRPNENFSAGRLVDFFDKIVANPIRPVGARRSFFQFRRWIMVKKKRPYVPAMWSKPGSDPEAL